MTRSDWLLLFCLFAMQPWLYAHFWRDQGMADTVLLKAPGQPPRQVALNHDQLLTVQGPLGDSVLEVQASRVRFRSSPCRGKQCIHSGWLSRAGDFAACLPNRVSITLIGAGVRYDAINY